MRTPGIESKYMFKTKLSNLSTLNDKYTNDVLQPSIIFVAYIKGRMLHFELIYKLISVMKLSK